MENNLKTNTYIYTEIHIHIFFAIHLKLAQQCKLTILERISSNELLLVLALSLSLLVYYLCMCSCSVAQVCPTLCNPMACSQSGSSVQGIFQARVLEWVAISSSRGSSCSRDQTYVSCSSMSPVLAGRFFTSVPLGKPVYMYILYIYIYIYICILYAYMCAC